MNGFGLFINKKVASKNSAVYLHLFSPLSLSHFWLGDRDPGLIPDSYVIATFL